LRSFGIKAGQYAEYQKAGLEPERFMEELRYQADAREPENSSVNWADDLPPLHRLAADMFYGKKEPVFLSSAVAEFQELKGEDPNSKAGALRRSVVSTFIAQFGDLSIDQYTRETANSFVKFLVKKGNKTATIKRRLNSIRPIFRQISRERELDDRRIFEAVNIPNEGYDKVDRLPFSTTEMTLIQKACLEKDDDFRWVVGLLSDTGLRLAEAIGLKVQDVFLDAANPYVVIRPNEARRLKTKGSERNVPLVGVALWAVKRAITHASNDFIFPRYIDFSKETLDNKSTHASNTLTKWLRSLHIADSAQKSTHSFRHSLQDRLKDVQTPQELRNAIGGWTNKGIGEGYGKGYTVAVLAGHMDRIVISEVVEGLPSMSHQTV
jgi:integrase